MREDLHFVDRLHRDLGGVRWAEPEKIRARARRRSRRTAALAATAVLAVLSGSAYAVAGRPVSPAPPVAGVPVPTVAARSAEIPPEALLSARDVRLTTGAQLGASGLGEAVRVDPVLEACGRERGVASLATSRHSRSQTLLLPVGAVAPPLLTQDVYRIDPGQGPLLFGAVALLLDACARWEVSGSGQRGGRTVPTVTPHRWERSASGFAGDESVLLRHVSLPPASVVDGTAPKIAPKVEATMVVRVGDLVTVITAGPAAVKVDDTGPGPGLSRADLEGLGRTAAGRLCAAANPRC
ncbi:hypothetical protein FHX75_12306 [Micromonospora palomenae]|uniref:Uncharacterized protein n=1 Tax=Micromonospora palomenae TaxID=1461247 RepID=A0A561WD50_9ACTN|nr:hypothetical protein [Micromonospora palomenae]TWG21790.1 hypothetical protein FHX75_12306 [Micromonospora palomenae]